METMCLRSPMINKRSECWSIVGWRRPSDHMNEREKSCLPYIRCVSLIITHPPKIDPVRPNPQRLKLLQTSKSENYIWGICVWNKYEIHKTGHFHYYPLLHRHSVRPVLFVPVIIEKPDHPNNFERKLSCQHDYLLNTNKLKYAY